MSRELDAAIARGLEYILREQNGEYCIIRWADSELYVEVLPHYSTDGNDMLELDGEMRERSRQLMIEVHNDGYTAAYWDVYKKVWSGDWIAEAMPEAVALAAYESLTGKG